MAIKQLDNDTPVDMAGPAQDVAGPGPTTAENPTNQEKGRARTASSEPCADDDTMTPPHGDKLGEKL